MVFGTFDYLHIGHVRLFQQAKKYGDHLIVVIGRDTTVKKVKGEPPIHTEKERREIIGHLHIVDEVLLGDKKNVYAMLKKKKPQVIALGYDQEAFVDGIDSYLKKNGIVSRIVRLKPYRGAQKKSRFKKEKVQRKRPFQSV